LTGPKNRSVKLSIGMLTHLECTRCREHYPADRPHTVCPKDAGILYARYDLAAIKKTFSSARLAGRAPTMWRYDAVLPAADPVTVTPYRPDLTVASACAIASSW